MDIVISKQYDDNWNKIAEIKALRNSAPMSLKEAKEAIEKIKEFGQAQIIIKDDTKDRDLDMLKHAGFAVTSGINLAKTPLSLSGKYLALVKEAIADDMPEFAQDMLDCYIKHFEI